MKTAGNEKDEAGKAAGGQPADASGKGSEAKGDTEMSEAKEASGKDGRSSTVPTSEGPAPGGLGEPASSPRLEKPMEVSKDWLCCCNSRTLL